MRSRIKESIIPFAAALIWTAASIFYEGRVFTVSPLLALHNYIPCKVLMLALLCCSFSFLVKAFKDRTSFSFRVLKYALIYFIPIILVLIYKLPQGFLSNDERLIFEQASSLADYTWFYYITTWYYIISMMIIPSWLGPVLIKVVIQCFSAGYVTARLKDHLGGSKKALLIYAAFLLPPILAYTTSAHRIPVYIFLYLLFMFILYMDMLEGVPFRWQRIIPLLFLMAVLTQWRTEGIYMAVFGLLIIILCYRMWDGVYPAGTGNSHPLQEREASRTDSDASGLRRRSLRKIFLLCILSFVIQYIVAIPQYGIIPKRMEDQAANRMLPFYAYTVTNLYRNGLDLSRPDNAASWKKVDRFLDTGTIAAINDHLGDINYEDALILYYQGFDGRRPEATDEDYQAFMEGVKELMRNNPAVLAKTKWGSFDYAATVYDPVFGQGLASLGVSLVKTVVYNLYIPMLLLLAMFLWSLLKIKERAFHALLSLCLLAHFAIVFILAPASYFKYYFPVYFTTYFFVILGAVMRLSSVKSRSAD